MKPEARPSASLLAFEVELNDALGIAFAPTLKAAQWTAVKAWRESGYGDRRRWPHHLKAWRRPDLDGAPASMKAVRIFYRETYLRDMWGFE